MLIESDSLSFSTLTGGSFATGSAFGASASGFDHHLVKPVDFDALKALLASLPTA